MFGQQFRITSALELCILGVLCYLIWGRLFPRVAVSVGLGVYAQIFFLSNINTVLPLGYRLKI